MKKQTKLLMNFALFMLLIVLTFYILLKDKKLYNKISSNAKKLGVNNSATLIYEEIKKLTNN